MAEWNPRANELFLKALDVPEPDRPVFLASECGEDADLRKAVKTLLNAHAAAGDFPGRGEHAGAVIAGKYELIETVGEGGMGAVWRAKQTEPVKRFVAVKLIKAGMDSKQVLARFEAERQALALMDHPNIAKVLDGGLHEQRPFFIMELVKGVPITDFCDARKLPPRERLELFVQACQAIQHAHQKGVIHRDIKPNNVLVALYDDRPVVKVIDFGVAKATGGALTERTIDTGFGGVVGTPQYMSPEQATFNNLDIDTRSDVYALGVLLYELLTGSPPFSRKELEAKGLLEILRVVREVEPPRPSTKLSTADALPSLSANRGTEPKKLTGLLRNELDWIVMKALEKDRTRRYETANGFAADVQRYLSGEAVQAHPPSRAYRAKKFVRRNKVQVIAASLVLLALVAGVVGTTLGLVEAKKQQQVAQANEREANDERAKAVAATEQERQAKQREQERADGERKSKEEAQRNLAFATKGNEILGSVFAGLDPNANYKTVAELRDALKGNLEKAMRELDGAAIGDPLSVAEMQDTLGRSLLALGDPLKAVMLFTKARETCAARRGPDHLQTLAITNNLAVAYRAAGKRDLVVPLLEEAFKLTRDRLGPDHPSTLVGLNNLASAYQDIGRLDLALPLLEEILRRRKAKLGPDHLDTLVSMTNLANAYRDTGRLDTALPLLEEAYELAKAKLGPDHPQTLTGMNSLASAYRADGRLDRAMPIYEETLRLRKATLGLDHPDTLRSMGNLASGYWSLKRLDKSVPLFEDLLPLMEKKLGRDHPSTQAAVANLGVNYKDAGRIKEALLLLEEVYHFSNKYPELGAFRTPLIDAYIKANKPTEAKKLAIEMLAEARTKSPKGSTQFADTVAGIGLNMLDLGFLTEAEILLRETLDLREKTQPDAWNTFNTQSMLGGALLGQKKYADAEPLLLKGYEGMKTREKAIPSVSGIRVPEALDRLIGLYTATKKPDEVKKYRDLRAKYPPELAPPPKLVK